MGTIDKVHWHTRVKGNPETREHIVERFWVVVDFLQKNKLTRKTLANSIIEIDDEFAINSDDLTDVGLEFMKKAYDKWLTKVDEGMPVGDISILQKTLARVGRTRMQCAA